MTDCTELRRPQAASRRDSEGQKGMPSQHRMTDCTELRRPHAVNGRDSEGQQGMRKAGTA